MGVVHPVRGSFIYFLLRKSLFWGRSLNPPKIEKNTSEKNRRTCIVPCFEIGKPANNPIASLRRTAHLQLYDPLYVLNPALHLGFCPHIGRHFLAPSKAQDAFFVLPCSAFSYPCLYFAFVPQVRQTFLEPVEWQISAIREAFLSTLSREHFFSNPLRSDAAGISSPINPDYTPGRTSLFPRPSVLAEIIQGGGGGDDDGGGGGGGSSGGGVGEVVGASVGGGDGGEWQSGSRGFSTEGEAVGGTGGRVRGRRKRGEPKDFDFREAFAVYEDRDLVACSPLREVRWARAVRASTVSTGVITRSMKTDAWYV